MKKGCLALVLHAHLPYVRHERAAWALEERWLYEALSETYLPLLQVFERLRKERVPYSLTLSISPTLLTMLRDEELGERYVKHLQKTIELTEKERGRTANEPIVRALADMYADQYGGLLNSYESSGRDVVARFADLQRSGHLELITCGATHGFLPTIGSEELRRAQIGIACDTHEAMIGSRPRGIWLPECGYLPGVERLLAEQSLQYFVLDSHSFGSKSVYHPLLINGTNVYALGRDPESTEQVWSSQIGYPGDPHYREYYRDIGFDLEESYIGNYVHPSGIRVNTGLKYFRVTGQGAHKELYDPQMARQRVEVHAEHFVRSRVEKIDALAQIAGGGERPPLITAPFDAELFGHWWYEGPSWVERVARKLAGSELAMVTPSGYLRQYPQAERAALSMSSWGRGGYADVWLNERNGWIYPHLHRLEERLVNAVRRAERQSQPARKALTERALRQLAREVMLAEASDWAFMITMETTEAYGVGRLSEHLKNAERLAEQIEAERVSAEWLAELERSTPIFPDLRLDHLLPANCTPDRQQPPLRVLMLSWEFPPRTIGGLARHVYDLSRELARAGVEVHVITCQGEGTEAYAHLAGVHVHRVEVPELQEGRFVEWSALLNIRLSAMGRRAIESFGPFQLIHAHDWLVAESALWLSAQFGLPVISTIHATEHGRNHGIHSELQAQIYQIERRLAERSHEVIVCSASMRQELQELYGVAAQKLHVLNNAVDRKALAEGVDGRSRRASEREKVVFYVGRLVPEKGVQVLLASAPSWMNRYPQARIIIAGIGPMLATLQDQARELGIEGRVEFAGFVTDQERNRLLRDADVAVFPSLYEPFGIVALEAMAAGAPTVVSRTGGLAEIVEHGEDGWLVEPGDSNSLSETILQLFADPITCQQVAERGQQKVIERYSWPAIAEGTIAVYRRALQQREQEVGGSR